MELALAFVFGPVLIFAATFFLEVAINNNIQKIQKEIHAQFAARAGEENKP
jgi:hypothetical protein